MDGYKKEFLKKLKQRPLLMPAVLLFLCCFVLCSFKVRQMPEYGLGTYDVFVYSKEGKLSGKSDICALTSEGRVKLDGVEADVGDRLHVTGRLTGFAEATNPGEFDYSSYMKRKGIVADLKADSVEVISVNPVFRFLDRLRNKPRETIKSLMSGLENDDAALLSAFCLGDHSLLDEDTKRDFRLTDCSHLLAVSGTHFSSFLIVLPVLLDLFPRKSKLRVISEIAFVLFIGMLTGWSESVTRAAVMSLCILFSRDSLSGMSFAALVMLVADPFTALSSGFQMSFGAVIGIMLFSDKIAKAFPEKCPKTIKKALAATIGAHAGLLPMYLETGSSLNPVLIICQFLSGFLIEFVCVFFVLGMIGALITPIFWQPAVFFAKLVCKTIGLFTGMSFDVPRIDELGGAFVLGVVVILVAILFSKELKREKVLIPLLTLAVILIGVSLCIYIMDKQGDELIFIDVGQGDCCLILGGGRSILIDGGTGEAASKVESVLDYKRIEKVDMAIMTHWDEDHGGGLLELMKAGRVDKIYTSYTGHNKNTDLLMAEHLGSEAVYDRFEPLKKGDCIELGKDSKLVIVWPDHPKDGENPDSVVALMESHGTRILFTGDIDMECEDMLDTGDIDILKVAHHGSRYSTGESFLQKTRPEVAIISVGLFNSYGHPSPDTIERLGEVEANIFETSKNGAISVRITKDKTEIKGFKDNRYGVEND